MQSIIWRRTVFITTSNEMSSGNYVTVYSPEEEIKTNKIDYHFHENTSTWTNVKRICVLLKFNGCDDWLIVYMNMILILIDTGWVSEGFFVQNWSCISWWRTLIMMQNIDFPVFFLFEIGTYNLFGCSSM